MALLRLSALYLVLPLALPATSSAAQFSTPGALGLGAAGSDDCATPTPISGSGTFAFDNGAATAGLEGQAELLCSAFSVTSVDHDVWFEWTADFTGDATLSSCDSTGVDTKLAAYPGGGCPVDGTSLACSDDACGLQSEVQFPVTQGTTYLLQIGTFPGASGGAGQFFVGEPQAPTCGTAHDGVSETSLGLNFGGDTLALVYVDCLSRVDQLEVAFGSPASPGLIATGTPTRVAVWDDPTNDMDPADALLLQSAVVPGGVATPDLDQPVVVDLVALLGAGVSVQGGCFVGVVVTHAVGEFPFALDRSSSEPGRDWIAGDSVGGSLDLANLGGSEFPPATLESISLPGHWLISASGAQPAGEPGSAFCACDVAAAPCANPAGAGRGCANGSNASGARLSASGTADVLNDSVTLLAEGLAPGQPGLFFQGTSQVAAGAGLAFGDGLRCAGGSVVRLEVAAADGGGSSASSPGLAAAGGVVAGDLRHYQLWYRDPVGSPCGSLFNLTNGYTIQW